MSEEFQPIRQQIITILNENFHPGSLEVIDDSHKHEGHAGHNGKGESHFRIKISSASFADKGRVEIHRMIYGALADLIPPIHALQIIATKT